MTNVQVIVFIHNCCFSLRLFCSCLWRSREPPNDLICSISQIQSSGSEHKTPSLRQIQSLKPLQEVVWYSSEQHFYHCEHLILSKTRSSTKTPAIITALWVNLSISVWWTNVFYCQVVNLCCPWRLGWEILLCVMFV